MLAVTAYPILYAFWLSLQRYNLASPADTRFVWFENYSTILTDKYWWTAFVITVVITVISVAIEFVLGMALALVMHRTIFGKVWCAPRSSFRTGSSRWPPPTAGTTRGRRAPGIWPICCPTAVRR